MNHAPNKFAPVSDYDIEQLGDRRRCIPGPEPIWPDSVPRRIPVCEPDLKGNEAAYVNQTVQSSWISSKGSFIDRFERDFSAKVGATYGCAVNSGTSALALCMAALNINSQSTVIIPTFTMAATAFAPSYLSAELCLTDADQHYCMAEGQLLGAISMCHTLTKGPPSAIVPVHIYGHPCDMDAIEHNARDIPVIYDNAEAHGTLYKGEPIGGRGLACAYSFFGNKTLTTGEGGMVVSNNKEFIDVCRNMRDMSFSSERHFWHKRLGYNFRMTNMQAAVGVAQTERYEQLVSKRQENGWHYYELLKDVPGISLQPQAAYAKSSHWMVGIEVDKYTYGMSRDELRQHLANNGVETRSYFIPIHLQPLYYQQFSGERFHVAEHLSERGLYLPSSSLLTAEDRQYVASVIARA